MDICKEDYFASGLDAIEAQRQIAREALQRARDSTLQLLQKVEERRDWSRLLSFPPDLLVDDRVTKKIDQIMTLIIKEGNKELFTTLFGILYSTRRVRKSLMKKLVELKVRWGEVPECLSEEGYFYECAVAKADDVELFRNYIRENELSDITYVIMGKYSAVQCMDFFGYGNDKVGHYLHGAMIAENCKTVHWLLTKSRKTREILLKEYILVCMSDVVKEGFVVEIIKSKIVVLTDAEWKTTRGLSPDFYDLLSADV